MEQLALELIVCCVEHEVPKESWESMLALDTQPIIVEAPQPKPRRRRVAILSALSLASFKASSAFNGRSSTPTTSFAFDVGRGDAVVVDRRSAPKHLK